MSESDHKSADVPHQPRRFQSTVAYYQRYRLAYPDRLIARVAALAGLNAGDAVLDLGCGTGMLAVGFAKLGMTVTAMDPEPDMLAACQQEARAAKVAVELRRGGSYDLTPDAGPFRLVVMGRSFHWMDRAATIGMLEHIVRPDGGVAFFHDSHPPVAENNWFKVMREVQDRFGRSEEPHIKERRGGHARYEPFLFASQFTRLDGLSVTIRQSLTLDDLVGRAFSMSTCSREKLKDRVEEFAGALRMALRELTPDETFLEVAELVALLARRPEQDG